MAETKEEILEDWNWLEKNLMPVLGKPYFFKMNYELLNNKNSNLLFLNF